MYKQYLKKFINTNSKCLFQFILNCFFLVLIVSCETQQTEKKLLIYGSREIVEKTDENNKTFNDTIYHTISNYQFVDQDSDFVTPETFSNCIYVTDFFFTTCPSICPKMTAQMMRVYEEFEENPKVKMLSHSIDPTHDTVAVLKEYADNLGVKSEKWHFVTGTRDDIFEMGRKNYMVAVVEDENAEGGFFHGGHFILVDNHRRIRGIYDGTDSLDVNNLLNDIPILLKEVNQDLTQ
ncbi:MAG: SCO family protein [Thalassobius sp.]|nr:SCO family protein [Thalassovita sp.]